MLATSSSPADVPATLSREWLLAHRCCPAAASTNGGLRVLVADGAETWAPQWVADQYGCEAEPVAASWTEVQRAIELLVGEHQTYSRAPHVPHSPGASTEEDIAADAPAVRFVGLLLREARRLRASDIHLETGASGARIRWRIDGELREGLLPPTDLSDRVAVRLKVLAGLAPGAHRTPADGRLRFADGTDFIDARVAVVPTLSGEAIAVRLLEQRGRPTTLAELQLPSDVEHSLRAQLRRQHGMILVTGPTGSGKTTSLYAALSERNRATERIITIEDPVEYDIPGVVQIPAGGATGIPIAEVLRAVLRQDPDVILVGEIRDGETAALALQAALTGHFVLASMHTRDALSALVRLQDLGCPTYAIAASVDAVLAQRLVSLQCANCCGIPTGSATCPRCAGRGVYGRRLVVEWLPMSEQVRSALRTGAEGFRAAATATGYTQFRDHVSALRRQGVGLAGEAEYLA